MIHMDTTLEMRFLKLVSSAIKDCLRNVDIVARYGGEEFSILLPETNLEDAKAIAEKNKLWQQK